MPEPKLHADKEKVPWARFDHNWYLLRYRNAYPELIHIKDPVLVQEFYLNHGRQRGDSPNPFFDELYYISRYPDIAKAVHERAYSCGFDHYCQTGYRSNSPHWLFDRTLYWGVCSDLDDEVFHDADLVNLYHHYLDRGDHERRAASLFFDPVYYEENRPLEEIEGTEDLGPFHDFLFRSVARKSKIRTTPYFDPAWYQRRYPEVSDEIERGLWSSALHHYLANGTPTKFDPLEYFSESAYRDWYPDIAAAIDSGILRNSYEHFLRQGVFELRSPAPGIDLDYYLAVHTEARREVLKKSTRDAFVHFITIGVPQGLTALPPQSGPTVDVSWQRLFETRAETMLPTYGRRPLRFDFTGPADVSVIVVAGKNLAQTLMSLSGLRANFWGAIELIVVVLDSGLFDDTRYISHHVCGARIIYFENNLDFIQGYNAGLSLATAENILLLDHATELTLGAIANALTRLTSEATIGAVAAKIIGTNGQLKEAGRIIWQDGTTTGYMQGSSPLVPEANFVRDVDCSSYIFLLLRGSLLREMVEIDTDYAPKAYGDTDLCVRIQQAGYRLAYDPSVVVYHLEDGTSADFGVAADTLDFSRSIFQSRQAAYLKRRYLPGENTALLARSARSSGQRILFIEGMLPLRTIGSGFVRSNDLIRTMTELGHNVTVYPMSKNKFNLGEVYADMPDTAEVMHDRSIDDLPTFLADRDGYFDTVWIARTHNLDQIIARTSNAMHGLPPGPRYVLDTEAIFSLRAQAKARLRDPPAIFDIAKALEREFRNAKECHEIVAVSQSEATLLRELGYGRAAVIGHARSYAPTGRKFRERRGLLFVGAIHHEDSPNYDGVCWFIENVMPLLEQELGYEAQFTIAGYMNRDVVRPLQWLNHPRVTLLGARPDLQAIYDAHRVFVAPTRYGAGLPYKIHEAAAFGIPVVASTIVSTQLGWESGRDILSADTGDPAAFAGAIVRLYRSEELWWSLRDAGGRRLQMENDWGVYAQQVAKVLRRVQAC